jgi:protein-S-isoprenylcysteine O-methyltransferase Ste14
LNRKALIGLIRLVIILPALVFVPAWTIRYWQAWACLLVFTASVVVTSGIIEVAPEQQVIAPGPYAIVRHPMYLGSLVMVLGIPLGLGSLWGLFAIVLLAAVIVLRLLDEERFLAQNLAGYAEYTKKVHYRLAPLVW